MTKSASVKKQPASIPYKKQICVKNRVTSIYSSAVTTSPTNLCGIECENGIYIAWLEKAGIVKEAAYIQPFVNAFKKTVKDETCLDLYPDSTVPGTILELWKIDYLMTRREQTREQSDSILFSKGFPFKCFVWIHPDDGPDAQLTLDDWLHNLHDQMMQFVRFSAKNEELYGKFKWGVNIRIVVEKTIHYAAQELLDSDVLRIICDSYHDHDLTELLTNDSVRSLYFGSDRSAQSLLDLAQQYHHKTE